MSMKFIHLISVEFENIDVYGVCLSWVVGKQTEMLLEKITNFLI